MRKKKNKSKQFDNLYEKNIVKHNFVKNIKQRFKLPLFWENLSCIQHENLCEYT